MARRCTSCTPSVLHRAVFGGERLAALSAADGTCSPHAGRADRTRVSAEDVRYFRQGAYRKRISRGPAGTAEVDADLVIIGPARPRIFRGPILGSTADHILSSARVSVLVIRSETDLRPHTIIASFDFGDPARGALDSAIEWASASVRADASAVEVVVLKVVPQECAGMDPRCGDRTGPDQRQRQFRERSSDAPMLSGTSYRHHDKTP